MTYSRESINIIFPTLAFLSTQLLIQNWLVSQFFCSQGQRIKQFLFNDGILFGNDIFENKTETGYLLHIWYN